MLIHNTNAYTLYKYIFNHADQLRPTISVVLIQIVSVHNSPVFTTAGTMYQTLSYTRSSTTSPQ